MRASRTARPHLYPRGLGLNRPLAALVILCLVVVTVASACQKGREPFGIVQALDTSWNIRIIEITPRVPVRSDPRVRIETPLRPGVELVRCSADLEYAVGTNNQPPDVDLASIGPETAPDSGVAVAELTWQVREDTAPQTVTVVATCYEGETRHVRSQSATATFEVIPEGTQ